MDDGTRTNTPTAPFGPDKADLKKMIGNPKALGVERATIGTLFKAETPGRSFLSLEIVEKNGKRKTITCQVNVM